MENLVVFTTDIEESKADIFDEIARKNFRSRAAHLKYLIEKEIGESEVKYE